MKINLEDLLDFKKQDNWIKNSIDFDITNLESMLSKNGEKFWIRIGEKRALYIFHQAATRIPAYKAFLKKHKIDHKKIVTIKDFSEVPLTDKKNYINVYPLEKKCWDGKLSKSDLIAVSSGTTGEPKFWPRGSYQEYESAITHELIYRYLFNIDKYKTLFIIGFPMGIYISGIATTIPTWLVSQKKYNITTMTVGNNKMEILRAVKFMQKDYEQIILIGHPFFIKDAIETGKDEGIVWSKKKLHIMSCSEGFNEVWRNYLLRKIGNKSDSTTFINTYGSSEMLLIGFETPMSIMTKYFLEHKGDTKNLLINLDRFPNLFQYNPLMRYIESIQNELVFTSASGIPLIRFNMHDSGEVISFNKVKSFLDDHDSSWNKKIKSWPIWQMPFVSLYGRSDKTLIFYAANIYPEHIHAGLNRKDFLKSITGKFTMRRDYSSNMDQFLEINVELRPKAKVDKKLSKKIQKSIVNSLLELNKEYLDASKHIDKNLTPRVILRPYQYEKYFKLGLKPKYIT